MSFSLGNEYILILEGLKSKIRQARLQAAAMLNNQLLLLYWEIGDAIIQQQEQRGWGAKVIENLSKDLRMEFPDFKGLSPRNLHYMKDFARAYPQSSFLQQPAAKLPWAHICVLLDKVKEPAERAFYSKKAVEEGWSRAILTAQIESDYIHRVGKAITNFQETLPAPYSDLAIESLKNPYIFDFLSIGEKMRERDLEKALLEKITKFLLELGTGFAFIGNQKLLEVAGDEFFPDLIFYQTRLRCYMVIDLKMRKFKPEDAGKMNFYLSAVDHIIKGPDDNPSIGLLLCKEAKHLVTEYALLDINKPIGVSTYQFTKSLPENYKSILPAVEELERRLELEIEHAKTPFDEKISALKQKIAEKQPDEIKLKKSAETLKALYRNTLLPFFEEMKGELDKMNEFFLDSSYQWQVRPEMPIPEGDISMLFSNLSDEAGLPDQLSFQAEFSGLKWSGTSNMRYTVIITCFFRDYQWQITFGSDDYKYNYHVPFPAETRQGILRAVADYLFGLINQNLNLEDKKTEL